jgi:hypothetical protein
MPRRGRSRYEPITRGYVCCADIWHKEIFHVDCRNGGAQQVFDDLARGFERAGWDIGNRSFDFRIMRRESVCWNLTIRNKLEVDPPHSTSPPFGRSSREIDR